MDVMADIVLADTSHCHRVFFLIIVEERDRIALSDPEVVRQFLIYDHRLIRRNQPGQFSHLAVAAKSVSPRVEADIVLRNGVHAFRICISRPARSGPERNAVDGPLIGPHTDSPVIAPQEGGDARIRFQCLHHFRAVRRIEARVYGDRRVVRHQVVKLPGQNIKDGVPQSESGRQQRCAAGNSDDRHPEALFVAEEISRADFLDKGQPLPDRSDIFEEDALAGFGRTGA